MTIGATWPHRSGGIGVTDNFAPPPVHSPSCSTFGTPVHSRCAIACVLSAGGEAPAEAGRPEVFVYCAGLVYDLQRHHVALGEVGVRPLRLVARDLALARPPRGSHCAKGGTEMRGPPHHPTLGSRSRPRPSSLRPPRAGRVSRRPRGAEGRPRFPGNSYPTPQRITSMVHLEGVCYPTGFGAPIGTRLVCGTPGGLRALPREGQHGIEEVHVGVHRLLGELLGSLLLLALLLDQVLRQSPVAIGLGA